MIIQIMQPKTATEPINYRNIYRLQFTLNRLQYVKICLRENRVVTNPNDRTIRFLENQVTIFHSEWIQELLYNCNPN